MTEYTNDHIARALHSTLAPGRSWDREAVEVCQRYRDAAEAALNASRVSNATVDEVAHAVDNATPYPVELHSGVCQFMAAQLVEMLTIAKRPEHSVWQPEDDQPTGPTPEPQDPAELCRMADEAQEEEAGSTANYFVYTDAHAAHLAIGAQDDGGRPVVSVVADEAQRAAVVYVLLEDIEDVVAALREAGRKALDEARKGR